MLGRVERRSPTRSTRSCRRAKSRFASARSGCSTRRRRRRSLLPTTRGLRGHAAAATAISICAAPRMQQNLALRHRVYDGGPRVLRQPGLSRDRNADPDALDARRRARLSRAQPRPPGRVLRAAAVAAALQADPDGRGHGPLLPDRALLPRRGSARRPPAGVHAGRRRDLVRDATTSSSAIVEARCSACSRPVGREIERAVPQDAVRRGDGALRVRQAGPALRYADPRALGRLQASSFGVFRDAVESGGAVRGLVVEGGAGASRRELDQLVEQAKQLARTGLVWARRRGRRRAELGAQGGRRRVDSCSARRRVRRRSSTCC